MNSSGIWRVWIIILVFSLLSFSAATDFPESYFSEPLPRGIVILQSIVSNAATDLFGELGAAFFFGILGMITAWLAYRPTPRSEECAHNKRRTKSSSERNVSYEENHSEKKSGPVAISFGRKQKPAANQEQPMVEQRFAKEAELPEAIDVTNSDHIHWLKSQSDSGNWHQAAMSCVIYRGDPHGFLDWLMNNPATDRCTAAILFLRFGGTDYLAAGKCRYTPVAYEAMERLLEAIHTRCEQGGFSDSNFGLLPGWDEDRQKCLAIIEERMVHADVKVPQGLLEPCYSGPVYPGDYEDVGEGDLMNRATLAKMLPHIYGNQRNSSD